jgi:hypothetical protein
LLLHFISLKFYLTIWTRWLIWIWHLLSHSDLRKRCCSLILLNVEFSSGRKRRKIICFVFSFFLSFLFELLLQGLCTFSLLLFCLFHSGFLTDFSVYDKSFWGLGCQKEI